MEKTRAELFVDAHLAAFRDEFHTHAMARVLKGERSARPVVALLKVARLPRDFDDDDYWCLEIAAAFWAVKFMEDVGVECTTRASEVGVVEWVW